MFAQNCWGMLRVLEAPKMPPTCSVKQANQNELEMMCRCGMWHAKLEASYMYNTGTHSHITSLITGRTPYLTRACTDFIACALAMLCCCLLSWLCYNFNESPKIVQNKQHEQSQKQQEGSLPVCPHSIK